MAEDFEKQIETLLKEINNEERAAKNDKALVYGCKCKLVDLYQELCSAKEELIIKQKQTKDPQKQNDLGEKIAKLDKIITNQHLDERADLAYQYINKTSQMYKDLYASGARLGIDYIVIPNGAAYYSPKTSMNDVPKTKSVNYAELGYEKGKPCANANGGAGTVFDGKDLILTCDMALYKELVNGKNYDQRGWVPFYNAGQQEYFCNDVLEQALESMIKETKGINHTLVPLECRHDIIPTYPQEIRWQQTRNGRPNDSGFSGPRKRRDISEQAPKVTVPRNRERD